MNHCFSYQEMISLSQNVGRDRVLRSFEFFRITIQNVPKTKQTNQLTKTKKKGFLTKFSRPLKKTKHKKLSPFAKTLQIKNLLYRRKARGLQWRRRITTYLQSISKPSFIRLQHHRQWESHTFLHTSHMSRFDPIF